jgi:hypothetical protein
MTLNNMTPITMADVPKIPFETPLFYKRQLWPSSFKLRPEHMAELESLIEKLESEVNLAIVTDTMVHDVAA